MGAKTGRRRTPNRQAGRTQRTRSSGSRNGKARVLFSPATIAQQQGRPTDEHALRRYRRNVVLVLIVGIALAFDPDQSDPFTLTKYVLLLLGVLVLSVLGAISWTRARHLPFWRSGLQWPLAAVVGWTAVTTITSTAPAISVYGLEESRDGLLTYLALGALVLVIVDAFDVRHLRRAVSVLWFGAGGVVIGYGALQLHDQLTSFGGTWDPVNWGVDPTKNPNWIFSTFGNPNHLAGLVVTVLPLGLALLFTRQRPWARGLTVALLVAGVAEVLYASSRGAWVGLLAGLAVLAVLLAREAWAHRRVILAVGGVAAVTVAGFLVLGDTRAPVGEQFGSIFDTGGRTTSERVELWRTAWRMGTDRPLLGYGPETYQVRFNRDQTPGYVQHEGPETQANGPHNTFLAYLSGQGFPGLLFFTGLVAVAGLRGVGALRRLRRLEEVPKADRPALFETRLLTAGLLAAGTTYLASAFFNTQVFGLTVLFWVVLALVAVVAVDVGVPDALRPRALLAAPQLPESPGAAVAGLPLAPGRAEANLGRGLAEPVDGLTVVVGVVALALAAGAAWWASGPYWADQTAIKATQQASTAFLLAERGDGAGSQAAALRSVELSREAIDRYPWEAQYRFSLANLLTELAPAAVQNPDAGPGAQRQAREYAAEARREYRRGAETGRMFTDYVTYGTGLVTLADKKIPGVDYDALLREALTAYRTALRLNPQSLSAASRLAGVHLLRDENERAVQVLDDFLDGLVRDRDKARTLVLIAQLHERNDQPARAEATWRRALELDPENEDAKKAVEAADDA